jgi:uncharacterized protein YjaG (DUF416 family)
MRTSIIATLAVTLLAFAQVSVSQSEFRIDNSSLQSFRETWQRLYRSLSRAERRNLENAIPLIAFSRYHSVTEVPPALLRGPIGPETIREQIAGMTYEEIIELSKTSAVEIERVPGR